MKIFRRVLTVLLLLIFIPSTLLLAKQLWDNMNSDRSNQNAVEIAQQAKTEVESPQLPQTENESLPPSKLVTVTDMDGTETQWTAVVIEDDPYMKTLESINLEALRQVNPEVVAWISIPGTKINYPVLQTDNNQHYLDHTWEGEKNTVGAIFMEYQNSRDFSDYNTIIYGHNMGATGEMFDTVADYTSMEFLQAHPHVYIVNDDGVFRYDIFASYATHVDSDAFGMVMNWDKTRQEFLDFVLEQSDLDSGIVPELKDQILSLATCYTYETRTRWIIHARLQMEEYIK